jgi:hypothetical protein
MAGRGEPDRDRAAGQALATDEKARRGAEEAAEPYPAWDEIAV